MRLVGRSSGATTDGQRQRREFINGEIRRSSPPRREPQVIATTPPTRRWYDGTSGIAGGSREIVSRRRLQPLQPGDLREGRDSAVLAV
jgi:hypothetical protein